MEVKILYEDENYVGIDKPVGLMVHPDGVLDDKTLVDWILENYPKLQGVGEEMKLRTGEVIERPGIVHRLDKETSGVLILAKNQDAFLHLKSQFKKRKVEKTYLALVYGNIKEEKGEIDRAIGKSRKDFRLWSAQRGAKGKMREACTRFRVLGRKEVGGDLPAKNSAQARKVTLLEVMPKTGRTHQIRVHLKAIHHPIVCDKLYAPNRDCLGFGRLMLHAKEISFLGIGGKTIRIESVLPREFSALDIESDLM